MKNPVRIVVPSSGLSLGTRIYTDDGAEIFGVNKIEFAPIVPGDFVRATITLAISACDIHAHALLSLESLQEAADAHGFTLTPKA